MKKETDKKTIILIVVSILCIIGSYFLIKSSLKTKENDENFEIEGIEITENKDIIKDTKVGELDILNPVLYNGTNGLSTYSATIKNNTEKDIKVNKLYAVFTIDGKEEKFILTSNVNIPKDTSFPINITFDKDVLNTTKIEYLLED